MSLRSSQESIKIRTAIKESANDKLNKIKLLNDNVLCFAKYSVFIPPSVEKNRRASLAYRTPETNSATVVILSLFVTVLSISSFDSLCVAFNVGGIVYTLYGHLDNDKYKFRFCQDFFVIYEGFLTDIPTIVLRYDLTSKNYIVTNNIDNQTFKFHPFTVDVLTGFKRTLVDNTICHVSSILNDKR